MRYGCSKRKNDAFLIGYYIIERITYNREYYISKTFKMPYFILKIKVVYHAKSVGSGSYEMISNKI